jgi:CRP-like cAMP-binding protein
MGLGVAAVTDVLALQLDADTLVGILGDQFPLVHRAIGGATRRLLALVRRLPGPGPESSRLLGPRPPGRLMNLVEVLLHLRTPGVPFERSSIDALAELAGKATQVAFEPGQTFWRHGERARRLGLIVDGSVACTAALDGTTASFRLGPGRPLGVVEALAGERRWHDAVAETAGVLIELDVEDLIDMFEDNVDIARLPRAGSAAARSSSSKRGWGQAASCWSSSHTDCVDSAGTSEPGQAMPEDADRMTGGEHAWTRSNGASAGAAPSASPLIDMVVFVDGRLESGRAVSGPPGSLELMGRVSRASRGPAPAYSEPEMFARRQAGRR